jgi:hypothetical protein
MGGRLGLTDVTVSGPLPEEIQNLLAWVACVAGAGTVEDYVAILSAAGFASFVVEDQRAALLEMVGTVRRRLLGAELLLGLGKLDGSNPLAAALGDLDVSKANHLAGKALALIEAGTIGYTLIIARNG